MIAGLAEDPAARQIRPVSYDLTLVVFTDYQCPFCRQMHARLTALAKEDGNVRIVFKDWAIFGESSVEAARRALAAKYQGKDEAFDRSEGHTSELQSLMSSSYAVFCFKKKNKIQSTYNPAALTYIN